jgi:transcriptional regulator with XRE-family HTH domain
MNLSQTLILRTKMLGAILRDARLKAGKSLKQAAALVGLSSGALASLERGHRSASISLPELELLAFYYRVPLRHFLSMQPAPSERRMDFDPRIVISLRQRMIGAMLRRHREEAGLSIRALAEAVGFPTSRISAYERGERPIPLPELETLLKRLGRSVDAYVDQQGPVAEWVKNQQVSENLKALPADLRNFLVDPQNQSYMRLAKRLSELSSEKLRNLAELLLEVTP